MSVTTSPESSREPAWDVARLFPDQGSWTVNDYFELTNSTNRLVEFDQGFIEVLAMPTEAHQAILQFLFLALHDFVFPEKLGKVFVAGLRVRTLENTYREPDIAFMLTENRERRSNDFWDGADLVMEVISPDSKSRDRDLNQKRTEYAAAGIPEYWIADPRERRIVVLNLQGGQYNEHGSFTDGDQATSVLLKGFSVAVTEVFAAADDE